MFDLDIRRADLSALISFVLQVVYYLALTLSTRNVKIHDKEMNAVIREHILEGRVKLQIVRGDITEEEVDAIVNAANAQLRHGGGVAGAILRRAGFRVQVESDAWIKEKGPVTHSEPAFTSGGNLACKYIIHAVGPVWGEGDEDTKLERAVTGTLKLADRLGVSSIAFPAISTGIFRFPKDRAAKVILEAIRGYLSSRPDSAIKLVRLTLFEQDTVEQFLTALEELLAK